MTSPNPAPKKRKRWLIPVIAVLAVIWVFSQVGKTPTNPALVVPSPSVAAVTAAPKEAAKVAVPEDPAVDKVALLKVVWNTMMDESDKDNIREAWAVANGDPATERLFARTFRDSFNSTSDTDITLDEAEAFLGWAAKH